MKKYTIILSMLFLTASLFANVFYVVPKSGSVAVYKNKNRNMNEKAIEKVSGRLKVLSSSGKHYQVKVEGSGKKGWIEQRLVKKVQGAQGKAFTFDDAIVEGYGMEHSFMNITEVDQTEAAPIELDRSFLSAIKRNSDKESVRRALK